MNAHTLDIMHGLNEHLKEIGLGHLAYVRWQTETTAIALVNTHSANTERVIVTDADENPELTRTRLQLDYWQRAANMYKAASESWQAIANQ